MWKNFSKMVTFWKNSFLNKIHPLMKGVLSFEIFEKKESLDFSSHKNGGVGKIGAGDLKKGVSLISILTNPFQC